MRLKDKVAVVTGAARGIGRACAHCLAAEGAKVVLSDVDEAGGEAAAEALQAEGAEALFVPCDVGDKAQVEALVERSVAAYGGVDTAVANAGIVKAAGFLDVTEEDWAGVVGTNLEGAWRVAQGTARRMIDAGRPGTIINILSIIAFGVARGLGTYAASKAGLLQLTRTMAMELARHRVRVNAIAPGYVLTEMNREFFASEAGEAMKKRIPQRRIGDPSELDGALLLLASDASSYMTGSTIVVDGGHLATGL